MATFVVSSNRVVDWTAPILGVLALAISGCSSASSGSSKIEKRLDGIERRLDQIVEAKSGRSSPVGTDHGKSKPETDSEQFLKAAKVAFAEDSNERGVALLSAALAKRPDFVAALDLFGERLRIQFDKAMEEADWELAQAQIPTYETAIRSGLAGCASVDDVDALLKKLHDLEPWTAALNDKVKSELAAISKSVDDKTTTDEALQGLDARLRDLPTARIHDAVLKDLFELTNKVAVRRNHLRREKLTERLAQLRTESQRTELKLATVRELITSADQLHSEVVELQPEDDNNKRFTTEVRDLRDQLDRVFQVRSLHETQTISDKDATLALEQARRLLTTGRSLANDGKLRMAGEQLAEAELTLGTVDRLSSLAVQKQARKMADEIRREAIGFRVQQERLYNLWAIGQLEDSLADYEKALGWFKNDKEAFKKALREKVGVIDAQLLHPATHALYTEMFQKLYGGLANAERAEITKAIELSDKRPLSDGTPPAAGK